MRDDPGGVATPGELRARLRERLSALKGELERLRFETDRRWDELLARLSEKPEEIVPEELLSEVPERPGAISAASARRIDAATTQVEALTAFLEECRHHASRVALLVEKGGQLEVWKSTGFGAGDPKGRTLPTEAAGGALIEGIPHRPDPEAAVFAFLGTAGASDAVLVPFVVREKISGAVYADVTGNGDHLDADAVALLTWVAGLAVDRLAVRKLAPSPALRAVRGGDVATTTDAAASFASIPSPERPAAPLPVEEGLPAPAPTATAVPSDEKAAPTAIAIGPRSSGGPLARTPEEEGRGEARTFARLLASEIKLYNEREVAEGRARGDLYARLRHDIERGRRLYEERIPADVRSGRDYYYEELVEILAGGRAEALR